MIRRTSLCVIALIIILLVMFSVPASYATNKRHESPAYLIPELQNMDVGAIISKSTPGAVSMEVPSHLLAAKGKDVGEQLENILIESDSNFLDVGKVLFLKAFGKYSDGSLKDITKDVQWISSDKMIGQFTGPGVLKGESVGDIKVYVVSGNSRSTAVAFSVETAGGPLLQLTPTEFVLGNTETGTKKDVSITIRNRGEGKLEWKASSTHQWLSLNRKGSSEGVELWGIKEDKKSVSGAGSAEIEITIDTVTLDEGEHRGEILIKSNGGDEKVKVTVNIVSLKTLSISPVAIKIGVGQKRNFRVVGIWSDGSRTDLSKAHEGEWLMSDPAVGSFQRNGSVFLAQKAGRVEFLRVRGDMSSNSAVVDVEEFISHPVLLVSPREVDLGSIGQSEHARGAYSLKNVGSGKLLWWTDGPEDWPSSDRRSIEGTIVDNVGHISLLIETEVGNKDGDLYPVTIKIGLNDNYVSYRKDLPLGAYRERIILTSNGGTRNIFFTFGITEKLSRPRLEIRPYGFDFGEIEVGRQLMKKIEVRNVGKDVLTWRAGLQRNRKMFRGVALTKGKYVSLLNEGIAGVNAYELPGHLMKDAEIRGGWSHNEGYPVSQNSGDQLIYNFKGTGIVMFVRGDERGEAIELSIDGGDSTVFDCQSEMRKRLEFVVATKLVEGNHKLTIKNMGGRLELEGMRVHSDKLLTARSGSIKLFPDRGTTKGEIDYVNVIIDSRNLMPGSYCENVLFYSDGGDGLAELSFEIKDIRTSEFIDIYRHVRGDDTLLTSDREPVKGFKREKGAVFKLFRKGTPGTSEFYGWHSPEAGDHFYSTDRLGGGKDLTGYDFEGSIGNIATIKLSNTRELFRWFNPGKGTHFYTTDPKAEGRTGDGYKYDGISGYVR
ncbi:MAG: hypothetical protein JXB42_08740 [Deltaproteobacteria bacterium]|nr:hypothetical protein [Deltaproteobacteria bacterium]